MGIKSICLVLHGGRTMYYSGEVINGFCQVEVTDDLVPCIELAFDGCAKVHWTETHTTNDGKKSQTHTRHITAHHDLFKYEQHLTDPYTGHVGPGVHQLPFTIQLPPGLVTSMEGSYGYIRYHIRAKAPSNWFSSLFKPKAIMPIQILQMIDTNIPQYQFPVAGLDSKTKCCLCCASGPLTVDARTDRAAYCPNEVATIVAHFQNQSTSNVRPYAKLVQKRVFHAQGKTRVSSKSWDLFPVGASGNALGEGGMDSWNGVQMRLPECFPSLTCGIIDVNYFIEIGLDIPWAFDLAVYLPIVIGTIPFSGQQMVTQQQPAFSGWAAGPWTGTGKQSGIAPASAPPIPQTEIGDIGAPPPNYFSTIFSSEVPTLAQEEEDKKDW